MQANHTQITHSNASTNKGSCQTSAFKGFNVISAKINQGLTIRKAKEESETKEEIRNKGRKSNSTQGKTRSHRDFPDYRITPTFHLKFCD